MHALSCLRLVAMDTCILPLPGMFIQNLWLDFEIPEVLKYVLKKSLFNTRSIWGLLVCNVQNVSELWNSSCLSKLRLNMKEAGAFTIRHYHIFALLLTYLFPLIIYLVSIVIALWWVSRTYPGITSVMKDHQLKQLSVYK